MKWEDQKHLERWLHLAVLLQNYSIDGMRIPDNEYEIRDMKYTP